MHLPEYPGALEGLTAVIAKVGSNIVDDVTMETLGRDHASELLAEVTGSRYEFNLVN